MKSVCRNVVFVFCLLSFACASIKTKPGVPQSLPATALKPFGRYLINDSKNLELISSAVHVGFSFEGTECRIYASLPSKNEHNYLQYELDGVYQKKIRIEGNVDEPIIITAQGAGKHTVWIYKATEAHTGAIVVQKVTGKNLKALEVPKAPLIEFIGNSITCGAAADPSEIPCNSGDYHDHHNAYMAYGPRVARALKANYIVTSVSGIGIYRNWNSDGPTMPQVYEKIDFQENNPKLWNFKTYSPKVVSIALGTNDFSGGDGKKKRLPFDSSTFVNAYINFVKLVKSKYPPAQIVLLTSPMTGGNSRNLLKNCIDVVKSNIDSLYPTDKKIIIHFFNPMTARGCSGHPSVEDHAILADELLPVFRDIIK